ncbi:MAG: aminotransferase class III-fold pyridoxal phosphate-dependent enzyme [Opitutaceae bacterium]|nr:aminotransferase class III-fold pyridoxal phosphate-dependent enzyme [Opitutaceae bacterium]
MNLSAQSPSVARSSTSRAEPSHFKPRLGELLRTLGLDLDYERGAGTRLTFRDEAGGEVEVLDLVGGYGSLLLGHAHPVLVAEAQRLLATGRPVHSQGSARRIATDLAAELARRAGGDYCVVFGNSGAEAVEAAMKHARLETGARTFIALERGFHGKTLGALQLTANPAYREPFTLAGVPVVRVRANDLTGLEAAFAQTDDLAGFIFEPVLGEGGVFPLAAEFVRRAAELCAQRGVPLIADECQTGLGRTGTFLASTALGVQPDYVILSKALGGGLAKISALLVQRARYDDGFDLQHTSTYAEDDHACAIARRTLDLIDEALLAAVRDKGAQLLAGLRALAARHPGVIADVRGAGLMLAVEFRRQSDAESFLLRFLSAQEDLGYILTGHLLHAHRIRVAPTLSEPFALRLEPSALITAAEIAQVLAAFAAVCRCIEQSDTLSLTRHLLGRPAAGTGENRYVRPEVRFMAHDAGAYRARQRRVPERRVAWLCHVVATDDFAVLEPSFAGATGAEREAFIERVAGRLAPVVLNVTDVRSATGEVVRFHPILLPFTSAWIKRRVDARQLAQPQALVQQGIDLARSLGCQVVALGQYTSIATCAGTRLVAHDMGITTGNSTAIALAVQAIERAHRQTGRAAADAVLVIAGAAGNIGRTCAEVLAPRYRRTILIGSRKPGSALRLRHLAERIPHATATTDLRAISAGDVVVAAVNAVDAPLAAADFAPGAVFCDLSVPVSLPPSAAPSRPDVLMIRGGIAALPGAEDLGIIDFPLPTGQAYGCMAEAMLLGLEGVRGTRFTGALTPWHVGQVAAMAARHGFRLAGYRQPGVSERHVRGMQYAVAL